MVNLFKNYVKLNAKRDCLLKNKLNLKNYVKLNAKLHFLLKIG